MKKLILTINENDEDLDFKNFLLKDIYKIFTCSFYVLRINSYRETQIYVIGNEKDIIAVQNYIAGYMSCLHKTLNENVQNFSSRAYGSKLGQTEFKMQYDELYP